MFTKNIYLTLIVILFSIGAYVGTLSYPRESAYFPRFIIGLLGFLGCFLLTKEVYKWVKKTDLPKADSGETTPIWNQPAYRKVAMMIASSVIYLLILSKVGFFITTFAYLPVMIWLLGIKKPATIAFSTGFVVFFIFLIFRMFLKVPFPEGLLF